MNKYIGIVVIAALSGLSCSKENPSEPAGTAPAIPTLAAPVNGAIDQSVSPILSWDASTGATSYGLQLSTINDFSNMLYDLDGLTGTTHQVAGLANSTNYFWRVNATNPDGTSGWADTWSFITTGTAPPVPLLSAPADNAIDQPTSPTLSWNASSGASSYTLQVSSANDFATFVYNDSGLTGTSRQIMGLTNSTSYFWRVRADNGYGNSEWSTVWKYTTERRRILVSSVAITSLSPDPGATVTPKDTIIASLRYAIADNVQSDYGFQVSIKFESTTPGTTFSVGETAQVDLLEREGNVTIEYPLQTIWNFQNLKHPVACYFYLHKMTSVNSSIVIAQTVRIAYQE